MRWVGGGVGGVSGGGGVVTGRRGEVSDELRLNGLGRCTKLPENEEEDAEPVEGDDVVDPLGGVGEEEGVDQWSFRPAPGGAGMTQGSFVKATSMDWPGAYAVGGGRVFTNVYNGNGLPFKNGAYSPTEVGRVEGEWTVPEEEVSEEVVEGVFPVEGRDVVKDPTPVEEEGEEE